MEVQDVVSLVGQPEYWPLMIGGLLFVLVLVLYRRVGKLAGATSRDLAALYDAVEQLTARFDRLPDAGFQAASDARLESPCGDDSAPLSAVGAVAGMAEGAAFAEVDEMSGELLAESGPAAALAGEGPEASVEDEAADGFSFDEAADEDAAVLAAAAEIEPAAALADEGLHIPAEEVPADGFSFDEAADEDDAVLAAAAEIEPAAALAGEGPEASVEEEPADGFSFDETADEDAAVLAAAAEIEPVAALADEGLEIPAEEVPVDGFSFDETVDEDDAVLAAAAEAELAAASEPEQEDDAAGDFAFDATAGGKGAPVAAEMPAEPVAPGGSTDDGEARSETESRQDSSGMSGAVAESESGTETMVVEPPGPAPVSDEDVAPTEQRQSPELVVLPGNPQRPEVALARCVQCGRKIAYPKRLSGKRVRCPSCKSGYVLP